MNSSKNPFIARDSVLSKYRLWWIAAPSNVRVDAVLLMFFAVFFVLGQLQRIQYDQLVIYGFDIVILLWLLLHGDWIQSFLKQVPQWMYTHPLAALTTAWVVASSVMGVHQSESARGMLVLIRLVMYALFAFSVGDFFANNHQRARTLLVTIGIVMTALGLLQFVLIPDTRFLFALGWDEHYFRLIGTLFDPNFMGMMIVITQLYVFTLAHHSSKHTNLYLISYSVLCSIALAATYSRASYTVWLLLLFLGLVSAKILPVTSIFKRILIIFVLGLSFVITFVLLPKPGGEGVNLYRTKSIQARMSSTTAQLTSGNNFSLWFGSGLFAPTHLGLSVQPETPTTVPASTSIPNRSQLPDNLLALLLTGTGIIGTLLIVATFISGLRWLWSREVALVAAVLLTLLHSQANNTLFQPFIFLFLLLAIATPLLFRQQLQKPASAYRRKQLRKALSKKRS